MTGLSVNQPINGNRGNANLLTVDGGFNLDSGSNNSQINNVGVDFIREVKIQTSNFSAEYGRNSGASINIVTRSGGNRFHGSAFEFLRNDKLDANNFFSNARGRFTDNPSAKSPDVIVPAGDARIGQKVVERPTLRYNNFGWSLGGPIKKDKFFFFAGMEWKYIRRFTNATNRTVPTRAERAGDFSLRLAGADGIPGTADDGFIKDPTKTEPAAAPTALLVSRTTRFQLNGSRLTVAHSQMSTLLWKGWRLPTRTRLLRTMLCFRCRIRSTFGRRFFASIICSTASTASTADTSTITMIWLIPSGSS
jgi:hypothetical protein